MADNTELNPGHGGDIYAADDVGGIKFQRVKLAVGDDGVNDGDVSKNNPMPVAAQGELIESIEGLRMAVQSLTRSVGQSMPDTAGRLRVLVDQISASLTLAAVTTVGTVSSVTAVANQTSMGGYSGTEQIPSLMRLGADAIRRNITVN